MDLPTPIVHFEETRGAIQTTRMDQQPATSIVHLGEIRGAIQTPHLLDTPSMRMRMRAAEKGDTMVDSFTCSLGRFSLDEPETKLTHFTFRRPDGSTYRKSITHDA